MAIYRHTKVSATELDAIDPERDWHEPGMDGRLGAYFELDADPDLVSLALTTMCNGRRTTRKNWTTLAQLPDEIAERLKRI